MTATSKANFDWHAWQGFLRGYLAGDTAAQMGRLPAALHALLAERIEGPPEHWRTTTPSGWYYGQTITDKQRIEQAGKHLAGMDKQTLAELFFQLTTWLTRLNPVIQATPEHWLPLPAQEHPAAYRKALADLLAFTQQGVVDMLKAAAAMEMRFSEQHALAVLDHLRQACLLWAARGAVCRTGFPYLAVSAIVCGHPYTTPIRALDTAKALHAAITLMPVSDADIRRLRDQLEIDASKLIARLEAETSASGQAAMPETARLAKFPSTELYRLFRDYAGKALATRGFKPVKKKANQWVRETAAGYLYIFFEIDGRYGSWSSTGGGRFALSAELSDAPPETLDRAETKNLQFLRTLNDSDFDELNRIRSTVFAKIRALGFSNETDRMLHEYSLTSIETEAKIPLSPDNIRGLEYYDQEDVENYLHAVLPRLKAFPEHIASGNTLA